MADDIELPPPDDGEHYTYTPEQVRRLIAERVAAALAAERERAAPDEPDAWLFDCTRPGERWRYASVSPTEIRGNRPWDSVVKTPLYVDPPAHAQPTAARTLPLDGRHGMAPDAQADARDADARRLDWFDANPYRIRYGLSLAQGKETWFALRGDGFCAVTTAPATLRSAIDAAMQAERGEPPR